MKTSTHKKASTTPKSRREPALGSSADAQIKELRKAVRLALPLLRIERKAWIDSYGMEAGDPSTIKNKQTIRDVARLDRAIELGELALAAKALQLDPDHKRDLSRASTPGGQGQTCRHRTTM